MASKIFFGSFDYAYNWYIKDAQGNQIDVFSTAPNEWIIRYFYRAQPARVEVQSPSNDKASIDIPAKNSLFVGVTGGNGKPVAIGSAELTR
ncbi:MAG: hypothetical protein AAF702_16985 [Chloroflexota bacterium]